MARPSILQSDRGRATSASWLASLLVHGAVAWGAIAAADRLTMEYSVARGRPVQVELSSRAQAARQPSSDQKRPEDQIEAILKPTEAVTEPQKTEPLQPRKLEVAKAKVEMLEISKQEPPPIDQPPPTAEPTPETPEELVAAQPQPVEHKPIAAPRRAMLRPDTVAAMASIAGLEQTTLGASVDDLPRKLANPSPIYPLEALLAGIEGRVVLRVLVTAEGLVRTADVSRSSGFPSLDASALAAIERWRFSPARRGGVAVDYEVLVPVRFSIRRG